MTIPTNGDVVVRTVDGERFTIDEVIDAGGENLYRLSSGEEIEEGAFVRGHDQDRAAYEVVEA